MLPPRAQCAQDRAHHRTFQAAQKGERAAELVLIGGFESAFRSTAITRRVGKGASLLPVQFVQPLMRLCPRCLTSRFVRVGKVARSPGAISSAAAGDFAHPTTV